jgi:hypothetical protein
MSDDERGERGPASGEAGELEVATVSRVSPRAWRLLRAEQHACVCVAHPRPARRDGRTSIPGRSANDQPGIVSAQAGVVV